MSLAWRLSAFATRHTPIKLARLHHDQPVASFTFDDFPRSAWEVAGPILARYAAKATYYPAGCYCGQMEGGLDYYDEQTLKDVVAAGHEIGCHTFSHEHGPDVSTALLRDDVERNAIFLREVLGEDLSLASFAYPYGDVSPRTKVLFARAFSTSRGIRPGVNGALTDLAQLKAVPLESRSWTAAEVERWVEAARAETGWLVFFSHDVSDAPSAFGCTPAMLEHALETVRAAGLEILPVKHAMAAAAFR